MKNEPQIIIETRDSSPQIRLLALAAFIQGWAVDFDCPGTMSIQRKKRLSESAALVAKELHDISEQVSVRVDIMPKIKEKGPVTCIGCEHTVYTLRHTPAGWGKSIRGWMCPTCIKECQE